MDITQLDHVGDGGVFTTINDLAKWDANFYENKLGYGQEFLDRMHSQGVLTDGVVLPYARGLGLVDYGGLKTVSHGGAFVGYLAQMKRFPDQHFSVIVLGNQNSADVTQLANQVADVCLAELLVK